MKFKKIQYEIRKFFNKILISDEDFIRCQFYQCMGRQVALERPEAFSDKIQWLKLHDRNPLYVTLADKVKARDYVAKTVGSDYLNEVYAVFDKAEDIRPESLPDSFVLKTNHGCGWQILCEDKNAFDWECAKKNLSHWLGLNYSAINREWHYEHIRPKILCEKLLKDKNGELLDYKFFCFDGNPLFVQVDLERFRNHERNFYDLTWAKQPFTLKYPSSERLVERPSNFTDMLGVAERLASNLKFVRVDLYSVDGKTLFGEMTFYPGNGMEIFTPPEYDSILGKYLTLPQQPGRSNPF